MPYAVIRDVPASWEHYASFAKAISDPVPPELLFHVAGPTDEGFRTIEVWESRAAWRRYCDERLGPDLLAGLWAPATLRELEAVSAVVGLGLERNHTTKEEA